MKAVRFMKDSASRINVLSDRNRSQKYLPQLSKSARDALWLASDLTSTAVKLPNTLK